MNKCKEGLLVYLHTRASELKIEYSITYILSYIIASKTYNIAYTQGI